MTVAMATNGAAIVQAQSAPVDAVTMETVIGGNLAPLTPGQRVAYYAKVCESVGLNPLTKPFDYLLLNGKVVLYTTKNCTDQLRAIKGVSVVIVSSVTDGDIHTVTAEATLADGRKDSDIGAVSLKGKSGDDLANAKMKAVTKAKRRVTLSICGLSMLDESELETVKGAQRVTVDASTGEIVGALPGGSVAAEVVTTDPAVGRAMEAEAKLVAEDRALATDWIAMIAATPDSDALAQWCYHHGSAYRVLHHKAKGKVSTALRVAATKHGVKEAEIKDWMAQSPDIEEGEAAE